MFNPFNFGHYLRLVSEVHQKYFKYIPMHIKKGEQSREESVTKEFPINLFASNWSQNFKSGW